MRRKLKVKTFCMQSVEIVVLRKSGGRTVNETKGGKIHPRFVFNEKLRY
jgi:hypothetical protein